MLHEGAKKVVADYGGSLPSTAKELKDLPGIGPYTAGAPDQSTFFTRRITLTREILCRSPFWHTAYQVSLCDTYFTNTLLQGLWLPSHSGSANRWWTET